MLEWPWKRFEAFYIAFAKRQAIESLTNLKLAMVTGFWSNDGMNDDKGTRKQALDDLEDQFAEAIELVLSGDKGKSEKEDLHRFTEEDMKNPFLMPAIRATRGIETPEETRGSVKDVIDNEKGTDFSSDQE